MRWISKEPPLYVWRGDSWYNEKDNLVYTADLTRGFWHHFESDDDQNPKIIPFPKKTRIFEIKNLSEL